MHDPRPISLLQSFYCAFRGVRDVARSQRNFRIHLTVSVAVVLIGLWLELPGHDWLWLLLCMGLVLTVELLNTAVEIAVDLACPGPHELARKAKDIAAGGVLVAALTAAAIGLIILLPPLLAAVRASLAPVAEQAY